MLARASIAFYRDRIYPALVNWLGNPKPILALREQIIPLARSTVLEIGVGSGANFPFYDRTMVERLYALEPNPGMLRLAYAQRHRTSLDIQFLTESVERIPLEDRSVDTVISTFTLCTLPILEPALRAIARVLKPDGSLIFLENSLATDPQVQRWQHLWEPIHRRVFEGHDCRERRVPQRANPISTGRQRWGGMRETPRSAAKHRGSAAEWHAPAQVHGRLRSTRRRFRREAGSSAAIVVRPTHRAQAARRASGSST
jgi:SAM-dependent methyltransferase